MDEEENAAAALEQLLLREGLLGGMVGIAERRGGRFATSGESEQGDIVIAVHPGEGGKSGVGEGFAADLHTFGLQTQRGRRLLKTCQRGALRCCACRRAQLSERSRHSQLPAQEQQGAGAAVAVGGSAGGQRSGHRSRRRKPSVLEAKEALLLHEGESVGSEAGRAGEGLQMVGGLPVVAAFAVCSCLTVKRRGLHLHDSRRWTGQ